MIGSIDLVLMTLERALTVTVLPSTTDADARQEASLGALFARWLRDVADHAGDAERESLRDLRAALAEVGNATPARSVGRASAAALDVIRSLFTEAPTDEIAEIRAAIRRAKTALARMLRAARQDDDHELAVAVRRILVRVAAREIERELAFTRATGMDPDAATVPPLGELVRRSRESRKEPR